jgi:hypothetical protein
MSAPIKDGGSAFPRPDGLAPDCRFLQAGAPGMSLRDYFAAKFAHAELMTCGVPGKACDALVKAIKQTGETPEQHMARVAYEMADAMLRAREVQS